MSRLIAGVSPKGPTIWRADAPEGANRHQISPQYRYTRSLTG